MRVAARISHPGSRRTWNSTASRVSLERRGKSTRIECPRLSLRRGDRTPRATAPNGGCPRRPRSANHALRSALGRCSGASTAASARDAARDREPGLRAPVYVPPRSWPTRRTSTRADAVAWGSLVLHVSAGGPCAPHPGARLAPAAGEDHRQRPGRLRSGQDPLGQADLQAPSDQLRAEPHEQAKQHPGGAGRNLGRSPTGAKGPRFRAASGQAVRAIIKPIAAQKVCGSEPPPPAGSGFAATSTVATPPVIRMSRPAKAAGLSASPVRTWQAPTPASASVITHRSVAPCAARELIVSATGLKERGCSAAATVQPPTSSTGATADETTPHHGTPRTTPP